MSHRNYTPRRASARWLEGAPPYVLDCFDNGGKTIDRYTVVFGKQFMISDARGHFIQYLAMSGTPTHPQGFSQWGENRSHEIAAWRKREGHYRCSWLGLPEHIRAHVIARATTND